MIAQTEAIELVSPPEKLDFAGFSENFRKECVEGSGIDPELYDEAIEIVADIEQADGGEPYYAIHEALGWRQDRIVRFGHQCRPTNYAALFRNEGGRVWQAKLASPLSDEKGKPRKYESPTWEIAGGARAYFPPIPDSIREKISRRWGVPVPFDCNFWEWVARFPLIPICLTEGGKKALSLLSEGVVAIALYGVNAGLQSKNKEGLAIEPTLIPDLHHLFFGANRQVSLGFDQDSKKETRDKVNAAIRKLGGCLENKYGATTRILRWDPEEGKGIDDFLVGGGSLQNLLATSKLGNFSRGDECTSKNKKLLKFFEEEYRERLKFNTMSQKVELDSKEICLDDFFLEIAEEFDIDLSEAKAARLAVRLARKQSYSPVRDYLDALPDGDSEFLDTLAERYLGNSDPFCALLLRRTLIAAVARIYDPGCQHDAITILHGGQGWKKSSFWRTLASAKYFDDTMADATEKDEKLKLIRYWILEYSEFQSAFRRKDIDQMKSFITCRKDSLRKPYGRDMEDFPRTCLLVGSTNEAEFLRDATGERRFWVIPISGEIPLELVESERDSIWAAAKSAYFSADAATRRWWLEREEIRTLEDSTARFKTVDPWEEEIDSAIADLTSIPCAELWEKVGVEPRNRDRKLAARIAGIMRQRGWTNEGAKGAKGKRLWRKVENNNEKSFDKNNATYATQEPNPLRIGDLVGGVTGGATGGATPSPATHKEELAQEPTQPGGAGGVTQKVTPPSESPSLQEIEPNSPGWRENKLFEKTEKVENTDCTAIAKDNAGNFFSVPRNLEGNLDLVEFPFKRQLLPIGTLVRVCASGWIRKVTSHFPSEEGFSSLEGLAYFYGPMDPAEYEVLGERDLLTQKSTIRLKAKYHEKQLAACAKAKEYFDPKWTFGIDSIDARMLHCHRNGSGKGKKKWSFTPAMVEVIRIS